MATLPRAESRSALRFCAGGGCSPESMVSKRSVLRSVPAGGFDAFASLWASGNSESFLDARYQFTGLCDPPRIAEIDVQVRTGLIRTDSALLRTTAVGVRTLYDALKRRKVVSRPRDQSPPVSALGSKCS